MAGWTSLGSRRVLEWAFAGGSSGIAKPQYLYLALVTAAVAPTAATTAFGQLTQVTPGNGYFNGGYKINFSSVDFPTSGIVAAKGFLDLKNIAFAANGGTLPVTGGVPKYAVLITGNDADVIADREVIYYWDLGVVSVLNDGQILAINSMETRIVP